MKHTQRTISVFSSDRKFTTSIVNQAQRENQDSKFKTDYSVQEAIRAVGQLGSCDLVIYDLGLAAGDQLRMAEDILHLKLASGSKPLLVVGQSVDIELALSSMKVKKVVERAIRKPVMPRQLKMIIGAVLGQANNAPITENNKPTLMLGVIERARKQVSNYL